MSDDEAKIIHLFGGDVEGEALQRWADRLGPYLDERVIVEPIRHRQMPESPWPPRDNPMLGYLIDRAREVLHDEGEDAALVWLAVHSWFEGTIEERFATVQRAIGKGSHPSAEAY
jgi:hypothetical protein